jgi:hypothetical protein
VPTTGADGTVLLEGLDLDSVHVLGVEGREARSDLAAYVNARWLPAEVTVRLARGLAVAGRVLDVRGKPVGGVFISCETEAGVDMQQTTREDGAFRFSGLGAGRVSLRASKDEDDGRVRLRADQHARAGDEGIELVLRPRRR